VAPILSIRLCFSGDPGGNPRLLKAVSAIDIPSRPFLTRPFGRAVAAIDFGADPMWTSIEGGRPTGICAFAWRSNERPTVADGGAVKREWRSRADQA
jgi:hypothetical protein